MLSHRVKIAIDSYGNWFTAYLLNPDNAAVKASFDEHREQLASIVTEEQADTREFCEAVTKRLERAEFEATKEMIRRYSSGNVFGMAIESLYKDLRRGDAHD